MRLLLRKFELILAWKLFSEVEGVVFDVSQEYIKGGQSRPLHPKYEIKIQRAENFFDLLNKLLPTPLVSVKDFELKNSP